MALNGGVDAHIVVLGRSGLATARAIARALGGGVISGFAPRVAAGEVDQTFDDAAGQIRRAFETGAAVIGVCASGILIRALAPLLADKRGEPPVLAVAEDGSAVVPLLGGHHGANEMARAIAIALGGVAAVTTAGDVRLGIALDQPPDGLALANPDVAKGVMARLLAGESADVDPALDDWLATAAIVRDPTAALRLITNVHVDAGDATTLVYHPRTLIVGVGSDRGCPPEQLIALVEETLRESGLAPVAVGAVVSIDRKADEPAVHAVARHLGVPARFLSADQINAVAGRIPNPSAVVAREVGVPGVAEGAALVAAGDGGRLAVEKRKSARGTCAIAQSVAMVAGCEIGRARGRLSVVGLGPGSLDWRSPEATRLLREATDWVGYGLYLDLAADLAGGKRQHRFALGGEEDRVRFALEMVARGGDVALICSGDPGIYAMAALVFEVIEAGFSDPVVTDGARRAEIVVAPGISAVQAAAARAGAPIGHDFALISLSDLLTPWEVIRRRVTAAAEGDFVVAFYNPRSERRRHQIVEAFEILSRHRPATTPVIIAANLGRADERVDVTTLAAFAPGVVDMLSVVLVGSSTTRALGFGDGTTRVYTPRGYDKKRSLR